MGSIASARFGAGWFSPRNEGPVKGLGEAGADGEEADSGADERKPSGAELLGAGSAGAATRGAPAGRRASSKVPHMPQKRKPSELFSPQFGQITGVLHGGLSTV